MRERRDSRPIYFQKSCYIYLASLRGTRPFRALLRLHVGRVCKRGILALLQHSLLLPPNDLVLFRQPDGEPLLDTNYIGPRKVSFQKGQ